MIIGHIIIVQSHLVNLKIYFIMSVIKKKRISSSFFLSHTFIIFLLFLQL